jgi:hypothetical protein
VISQIFANNPALARDFLMRRAVSMIAVSGSKVLFSVLTSPFLYNAHFARVTITADHWILVDFCYYF